MTRRVVDSATTKRCGTPARDLFSTDRADENAQTCHTTRGAWELGCGRADCFGCQTDSRRVRPGAAGSVATIGVACDGHRGGVAQPQRRSNLGLGRVDGDRGTPPVAGRQGAISHATTPSTSCVRATAVASQVTGREGAGESMRDGRAGASSGVCPFDVRRRADDGSAKHMRVDVSTAAKWRCGHECGSR